MAYSAEDKGVMDMCPVFSDVRLLSSRTLRKEIPLLRSSESWYLQ